MKIVNSKSAQCKKGINNNAGFSLIEVMIAMAIFAFIIGGIIMFSVNSIKANTKSQAMQEAVDNARYAMDDLAKKIRTSSNVSLSDGSGKELFFIDNKTLTKYCYKFDNDQMLVLRFELEIGADGEINTAKADIYNGVYDCDTFPGAAGAGIPVIGDSGTGKVKIDGKFEVMGTEIASDGNPHRGFVRIIVDMVYNDSGSPENRAETHLQSGVSIADYEREDGFVLDATEEITNP